MIERGTVVNLLQQLIDAPEAIVATDDVTTGGCDVFERWAHLDSSLYDTASLQLTYGHTAKSLDQNVERRHQ